MFYTQRKLIFVFLLVFFIFDVCAADQFFASAKQAIVVDYKTGQILYEKNSDQKMTPSSMSKLMTLYIAFDKLKNGQINPEDTYRVSKKAWQRGGSTMFLKEGQRVKVKDLLKGVAVVSGNDASITLAEGICGSEEKFVELMNQTAKSIGLTNSNFKNSSGWPEDQHFMTSADLAKLAVALYRDFPQYCSLFALKSLLYNGITQKNTNESLFALDAVDGIKTGRTQDGGWGVVVSWQKDSQRVFAVVNGLNSSQKRLQEVKNILSYISNNFKNKTIFKKDDIIGLIDILFGEESKLEIVANDDLDIVYQGGKKDLVKIRLLYSARLEAPIKKGQEIAKIVLTMPDLQVRSYTIFATRDVKRIGPLKEKWYRLIKFIVGRV